MIYRTSGSRHLGDCSLIKHLCGNAKSSSRTSSTLTVWGQVASATSRDLSVESTDLPNDLAKFMLTSGVLHPKARALLIRNRDDTRKGHWRYAPRLTSDAAELDKCAKALHRFNLALHYRDGALWHQDAEHTPHLLLDELMSAHPSLNLMIVHHLLSKEGAANEIALESRTTHTRLTVRQCRRTPPFTEEPLKQTLGPDDLGIQPTPPTDDWYWISTLPHAIGIPEEKKVAIVNAAATTAGEFKETLGGDWRPAAGESPNFKTDVKNKLLEGNRTLLKKFAFTNAALSAAWANEVEEGKTNTDLVVALFPIRVFGEGQPSELIGILYEDEITPAELDLEFLKFRNLYTNVASQMESDPYSRAAYQCNNIVSQSLFPDGRDHNASNAMRAEPVLQTARTARWRRIANALGTNENSLDRVAQARLLKGLGRRTPAISLQACRSLANDPTQEETTCSFKCTSPGRVLRAITVLRAARAAITLNHLTEHVTVEVKVTADPPEYHQGLAKLTSLVQKSTHTGATSTALCKLKYAANKTEISQTSPCERHDHVTFTFQFDKGDELA